MADPSYNLEVFAAPVVAEWLDPDGRTQYLSTQLDSRTPVTLDVGFDASANSAFFKLRVPFYTKLRPREETPVFIFIPPERVSTLSTDQPDVVPKDVKVHLDTDLVRLRLHMQKPADFVVPVDELVPKNKVNGAVLCIANLLARGAIITLYVAKISEEQLRPLCDAISRGGVRSIEKFTDTSTLYFGKGGRVYTDADGVLSAQALSPEAEASDSREAGPSGSQQQGRTPRPGKEPLPPYPALLPFPAPGSRHADASKKRRRHSSGAGIEQDNSMMLRRLVVEMFGGLGQEVHNLKEELRDTKQELQDTKRELRDAKWELQSTVERLQAVQDEVSEVKEQYVDREEMEDRIEDILHQTDAQLNFQVDEMLTSAKLDLEEFVTDRLHSTGSEIAQRLRGADITLDIQFDSP